MMTGQPRHFLTLQDFDKATLRHLLDLAAELKLRLRRGERPALLRDKMLAMIFERQSTRTRVSFDVGMRQLGGESIMLTGAEMQLGRSFNCRAMAQSVLYKSPQCFQLVD